MAGPKKKKKPAAGPSRGFATTSIASKPRLELSDLAEDPTGDQAPKGTESSAPKDSVSAADGPATAPSGNSSALAQLSPEDFEKQLEESELQLFVEKHGPKVKRDSQRQRARLDIDRRVLRGQACSLNLHKWLPPVVMDHIIDLIQAENRFAATGQPSSEPGSGGKSLSEEDIMVRLWTLRQTLLAIGFLYTRVRPTLKHVLEMSSTVSPTTKESLWGLEEALSWLARECDARELPDYDGRVPVNTKLAVPPSDTPDSSRTQTPTHRLDMSEAPTSRNAAKDDDTASVAKILPPHKKAIVVTCDSDIEPDDLVPNWVKTQEHLRRLGQPTKTGSRSRQEGASDQVQNTDKDEEIAVLRARIIRIEGDVLFDKFVAEQHWRARKPVVEREMVAARRQEQKATHDADHPELEPGQTVSRNRGASVTQQAEAVAAEVLAENGDGDNFAGLANLFASLPVAEVDAASGNESTGMIMVVRNFGSWAGPSPTRTLDEACRSRDNAVKVTYKLISDISFAKRHMVRIQWSKPQELPVIDFPSDEVETALQPTQFDFAMRLVATADEKQSEAFVATYALFCLFSWSPKDEKVFLHLPAVWRELWSEMADKRKCQLDERDRAEVRELRDMVRQRQDQEDQDGVINPDAFRGRGNGRNLGETGDDTGQDRPGRMLPNPEALQQLWAEKSSTRRYQDMLQSRMRLPIWAYKQQVIDAVDNNQTVIICGETGCGKSTQTPAFLLEHQLSQGKACKIYCTEPRRISALSLARRVSEELGETKNELGTHRSLVGYAIRLESQMTRETRLVYATTGIVMRMLEGSHDLSEITHLVLDEVHERTIDSDFLLIVLKRLLVRRRDLKLVLMSATVDADRFSQYLGGAPVLRVPGRTFPVQVRYLEDAIELTGYSVGHTTTAADRMVDLDEDLPGDTPGPGTGAMAGVGIGEEGGGPAVEARTTAAALTPQYSAKTRSTLAQMDEYRIEFELIVELMIKVATDPALQQYSSAILVFLPGIAEIRTVNDMVLGHPFFAQGWHVYPLHSAVATDDQEAAFVVPPPGIRKVVLATNIAETGITIPDVTCVVDTGKHREMRFDERRQLSRLLDAFISRANAKQRRGRAGRVRDGLCFHLFTRHRHDTVLAEQQTPEMLRLSLQDLAIRVKACGLGAIEDTLAEALDPPSAKNIRRAVDALIDVGALPHYLHSLSPLTPLTPLGLQLARLPVDVFLGKLMLLGTVFRCLDMAVTVAAVLSSKTPFSAPFGQRAQADKARRAFRRADSDVLTVYAAYQAWKRACQAVPSREAAFCRKNFLSPHALAAIEDLKGQLLSALVDSGFLAVTDDERRALARFRHLAPAARAHAARRFLDLPQRVNLHSDCDALATAVLAWSFFPRLLVRDGPGAARPLRNLGTGQVISLHPTSVNRARPELEWLSYYHIMQAKQVYHAHETTAVDPFAVALLCGDVRYEMYAGVLVLEGNRGRFSVPDWKTMLALKVLRTRLRELVGRAFRQPGRLPTTQHERWLDVWQRIVAEQLPAG